MDAVRLAIGVYAFQLVRNSKYKVYTRWLLFNVLSEVFALLYRSSHILAYASLPLPNRAFLLMLDQFFVLLDISTSICSLVIMVRLFKDIANRFHMEQSANLFKQATTTMEPGIWPPPPV